MFIDHIELILETRIAETTLSNILSSKVKIESADNIGFRVRAAKYPELEDCVSIYLNQLLEKGIPVSDNILIEKS